MFTLLHSVFGRVRLANQESASEGPFNIICVFSGDYRFLCMLGALGRDYFQFACQAIEL